MKVSIITPVFNGVATIERTILSVIKQEEVELEYIIVDGLSSDGTDLIIDKYLRYITKYIREEDLGIYDAMNKGIRVATGDLIGIINSDDWYEAGCIKKVVDTFAENNCDVVFGDINIFDGKEIYKHSAGELKRLCLEMVIPHPTVFVKKSVYEQIGEFDEEYHIAGDYDFLLRAYMNKYKFGYLSKVIANFSLGGLSTTNESLSDKETKTIMSKWIDDDILYDCFEDLLDVKLVVHGAGYWGKWIVDRLQKMYTDDILWIDQKAEENGKALINGMKVLRPDENKTNRQIIIAIYESEELENLYRIQGKKYITIFSILQKYMNQIYKSRELMVLE